MWPDIHVTGNNYLSCILSHRDIVQDEAAQALAKFFDKPSPINTDWGFGLFGFGTGVIKEQGYVR
jgi:hypothetical protein